MSSAQMHLVAFKVTNYRSVRDSGWIDASEITALIGTNESGKTNLLMPLWKLNPAKEGEIKLLCDAPRKEYNAIRSAERKPIFITARFVLDDEIARRVAASAGVPVDEVQEVEFSRDLAGQLFTMFPNATSSPTIPQSEIVDLLNAAATDILAFDPVDEPDTTRKTTVLLAVRKAVVLASKMPESLGAVELEQVTEVLDPATPKDASANSIVAARYNQLAGAIAASLEKAGKRGANDSAPARKLIEDNMPSFVYYTTYGNLDSEIYLPHVIEDLKRTDLTGRSEARARTLRVLFDFVRLKAEEIRELGKDWNESQGTPTEAQIQTLSEKKQERSVLMQSAGTELTTKFREWWKQGEYRIRFEADGNHFRIWVSDDLRPEEIELEARSTGLQWFLSFYLIFLVESKAAHHGAILLLDEPGLSLHPLAQKDLAIFFENLAKSNQLLYTTHSPFLVDADHLDRVRAVYVDEAGQTAVSTNLRAGASAAQTKSIYPVHAALGLSVSDTMFAGCRVIVVEGQSDQLYLSAFKNVLMSTGRLRPSREMLFVPTSGAKAIKTVAAILGGKDNDLPMVLCDGDKAGVTLAQLLRDGMYANSPERVVLVSDVSPITEAEVEDLLPARFLAPIIERYLRGPDESPFEPGAVDSPIVPQVKAYAKNHGLTLDKGWKVEVARIAKAKITPAITSDDSWKSTLDLWQKLFDRWA